MSVEEAAAQLTHPAMLVAWGQVAQCLGLIEQLQAVPIQQKAVEHSPRSACWIPRKISA